MKTSRLLKYSLGLLCSLMFCAGQALAVDGATDIDTVLRQLESNRRAVVKENLQLAQHQREAFWEVYTDYRREMTALQAERFKMLREFRASFDSLSDARAQEMLTTYLDGEAKAAAIRKAYINRFNSVLATKKTLRFFQIDVKVDSIIQAEMSANNPLVAD